MVLAVGACRSAPPSRPAQANRLPFGVMEAPRDGETVGRVVDVVGWAIDESAVTAVRIYVDGRFKVSVKPNGERADIADRLAWFPHQQTQWQAEVDLGESGGAHAILAQAIDDRDATRDLASVVVHVIARE